MDVCLRCGGDLLLLGRIDLGHGSLCPRCFTEQASAPTAPRPLELATNEELIEELVNRATFRGTVFWQVENFKGTLLDGWRWRSNNCDAMLVCNEMAAALGGRDQG